MAGLFSGLDTPRWLSNEETWNKPQKESLGDIVLSSFSDSLQAKKQAQGDNSPVPAWLKPFSDESKQLQVDNLKLGIQGKQMELARQHNMLDYQSQSKAGEVALSGVLAKLAKTGSWNDPQARADVFDVATKYPALMDTPVWQHTQDNFTKADKAAADAERYKAQADAADERLGISQDRLGLEQQRVDLEKSKADAGPADVRIADTIIKTEQDAKDAESAGNTELAKQLRERAQLIRDQSKTQEVTTGYDDQGRPIVRVGKGVGSGQATVGTESLAQQKLIKYENATQLLNTLEKNLKPEDVGVAGVAGEYLVDRGMSQLDPRFANKSRIKNRDALTIAKESLMREVGDDRRFTAQDREDISNALPSNGAFESYPAAIQKIKTVRGIIADRARNYAERLGEPVPMFAQSKDEIVSGFQKKKSAILKAVKLGNVSQEDADTQIAAENKKALDALIKFH